MATTHTSSLEASIAEAIGRHTYCSFGTVEGDRPKVRYMAIAHEGLQLYLASDRKTHKVEELSNNPNIYLLLGYNGQWPSEVIEVEGICAVTSDETLRRQVWREELKPWLSGPDDPDYVVLNVTPSRIEWTVPGEERRIWST
jgi:general stress protein 26